MNLLHIGIDVGAVGGIAWNNPGEGLKAVKMPPTPDGIVSLLKVITHGTSARETHCYMEKVGGYTGQGQPGSRMFNFGKGYGVLLGALLSLGITPVEIVPGVWQKAFLSGVKSADKMAHKRRLKAVAQRLFPQIKVTLSTCDALLIREYGVREERKRHAI